MVIYLFNLSRLKVIWNNFVIIIIVKVMVKLLLGFVVIKLVIIVVCIIVMGLVGLEIKVGVLLNKVVKNFMIIVF